MSNERDRLLKDQSAAEELVRWGERHGDAFCEALGLARLGAEKKRFKRIFELSEGLDAWALEKLEQTMVAWPDAMRPANVSDLSQLAHPRLRLTRTLNLMAFSVTDADIKVIAASEYLCHITTLSLIDDGNSCNDIGPEGARAIAASKVLCHLEDLDLTNMEGACNHIEADGARAIAKSSFMRHLTSLGLRSNDIGNDGVSAIANSEYMCNLTYLDLSYNDIDDDALFDIANSPHMRNLTTLDIGENDITGSGIKDLVESPYLSSALRGLLWDEWQNGHIL